MSIQPSELEIIDAAIARAFLSVHTSFPARVISYAAATQTCSVQPVIERADITIPVLQDVPVMTLGGGGFFISFPITAGDHVLIVCSECDFSQWFATGDTAKENFALRYGLHAIAIPGIRASTKALTTASASDLVIGKDAGLKATFKSSVIELGAASNFVALANLVATELTRINTDLTTLKTAISGGFTAVGIGAAANGPAGATSFNGASAAVPSSPGSVAATKVKAE